ncbi:MAG TPA: EAL domain-containing protein [Acidisoma sp.]|jgi:diguanylate cyclase (GGDEF)-like protein|nr:EAL domain-containing protein [Acidisoma sp.]
MKPVLRIQQALSKTTLYVQETQRLRDVAATQSIRDIETFAIFSDSGSFKGIISAQEAALFPGRIFADLLVRRQPPLLKAEDPLEEAMLLFDTERIDRIGVSNKHGQFCGVVSRASMLEALFAREHRLAYYDQLTGLPNRFFLQSHLEQLIKTSEQAGAPFALAFIDLDNFKNINDALGHRVGDKVLAEIGRRLEQGRRACDVISRFGGDEFVAVISDYDSEEMLKGIVGELFSCLNGHVTVDEHEIFVTASVGVSRYPRDALDTETMLRNADLAMYRSKDDGREQFHFYEADMGTDAARHLRLQSLLRHAYDNGNFWLAWQPQFNLETSEIVGVEVLMRCTIPEVGPIAPSTFIPIAEQSGLIISLGEWAFQQVARETANHLAELLPSGFRISVNLSVSQLNTAIMRDVLETAKSIHGQGFRLEIEITESALMKASPQADAFIEQLTAHAVEIAVDDFGTGYSNLVRLRDMPVNRLKIAPSFTRDLDQAGSRSTKIVAAVVALSRAMSIQVTAEGVERPEQAELLRQLGCDDAQGYWYAQPMPVADFAALLGPPKSVDTRAETVVASLDERRRVR